MNRDRGSMNKLDYTFERDDVLVGTTDDGARVYVSGHLYRQSVSRERQTITHGTVVDPENLGGTVVAFTGTKNSSRNFANGRHDESFIARVTSPADGWTLPEVRELYTIIKRWHGNAFRAGCAHIDTSGKSQDELLDHAVCPETGYGYGSQWLVDPLPDEVRNRFIELMGKGRSGTINY
jgi:hypothetical protein